MSKKSWLNLYSNILYLIGQDFLGRQYLYIVHIELTLSPPLRSIFSPAEDPPPRPPSVKNLSVDNSKRYDFKAFYPFFVAIFSFSPSFFFFSLHLNFQLFSPSGHPPITTMVFCQIYSPEVTCWRAPTRPSRRIRRRGGGEGSEEEELASRSGNQLHIFLLYIYSSSLPPPYLYQIVTQKQVRTQGAISVI